METIKGYTIENFKKLDEPIHKGILEHHIYGGNIKNVPVLRYGKLINEYLDFYCTWDKFGRCSNWRREDCFINIESI